MCLRNVLCASVLVLVSLWNKESLTVWLISFTHICQCRCSVLRPCSSSVTRCARTLSDRSDTLTYQNLMERREWYLTRSISGIDRIGRNPIQPRKGFWSIPAFRDPFLTLTYVDCSMSIVREVPKSWPDAIAVTPFLCAHVEHTRKGIPSHARSRDFRFCTSWTCRAPLSWCKPLPLS